MLARILGSKSIVVTGRVNSGKTTTLAGLVDILCPLFENVDIFTPYSQQFLRRFKNPSSNVHCHQADDMERLLEVSKNRDASQQNLIVVDDLAIMLPQPTPLGTIQHKLLSNRYAKTVIAQQSAVMVNSHGMMQTYKSPVINMPDTYFVYSEVDNGVCYVSDDVRKTKLEVLVRQARRIRTVQRLLGDNL